MVGSSRSDLRARVTTRWWRRNREESPDLFDDELTEALAAIRREPAVGAIHPSKHPVVVRKRLMPRTKNHVYFAVDESIILIVSIGGRRVGVVRSCDGVGVRT